MRPVTVLVCGHVTLDQVGDASLPGGSAWYAAHALAALGARPRVLTAAGPDYPREALGDLPAEIARAGATTRFANDYAADGTRAQRVLSAAPPLDPARLPAAWRAPDVLHLAPVLGEIDVRAFTAAAPARLVGLCVQGLVRAVASDGAVRHRPWDLDPAALSAVGAAVLGEDDVREEPDLVRRLAAAVPIVAFTHGVRGCDVLAGGRTRWVGVHPVREVDPTGAGDVFAAAFFLALARGEEPVEAARLGAGAASFVVEARGGEALPRVGGAFARAARVPVEAPAEGS